MSRFNRTHVHLATVVIAVGLSRGAFAQGIKGTEVDTAKRQIKKAFDAKVDDKASRESEQTHRDADARYEATWDSLARHETPQWFEDAVLGIYFHWGVYSVAGFGCWGGRNMYQPNGGRSEAWGHIDKTKYANTYDYVKQVYGEPGTKFGYVDFIPMFKAEKWNPDEWAALFKEAGADFAGPVAIHHDGFAMWDSAHTEYDSMEKGPRRDVTGEMLEAVRRQGIKTFASFHYYTNWFFFNPGREICPPGVDVNDPDCAGLYGPVRAYKGNWQETPMSEAFQQGWYNRVVEVIDKYHPDQLWFEIGFSDLDCISQDYVKSALAHYFNTADKRGMEVVVTRKADDLPLSCSALDIEAGELDEPREDVWQTDTTIGINWAWAYSPDAVAQPANALIDAIVDRKSKNGVTLLSAAPRADGTLPPSQVAALRQIGVWMAVNKPALYGSTPAPFVEGAADSWKAGTIRFTAKGNNLYAIELGNDFEETDPSPEYPESVPPKAPYVIPGVKPVAGSEIMMLGADMSLPWRQNGEDVVIEALPDPLPCDHAWTFKLQFK
jgi:alpha-L-fucosidase